MKPISTVALILALSGSLAAQAPANRQGRGGGQQGRPRVTQMDANGDGKISAAEWQGRSEMFTRLDSNNDGFITQDEMTRNRPGNGAGPRGALNPQAMDTNNDGRISREEWKGPSEAFDRLDANHDGAITSDERPGIGQRNGQRNGQNSRRPAGAGPRRAEDANKDGKISRDEWQGRSEAFDRLDANHDGSIDPAEVRGRNR